MRRIIRVILGLTVIGSLLALGLSVWPGVLEDLLLMAIIFSVLWGPPLAIIAVLVLAIRIDRRPEQGRPGRSPILEITAIPAVVVVTLILLYDSVPRRAAFLASRPAFETWAAKAPRSEFHGVPIEARLGVYRVDEFAADPRGGVYFRVHAGMDGIGPDTMSHGFVKRPNSKGTPFGAAGYGVVPITDDWYWFWASNDWY